MDKEMNDKVEELDFDEDEAYSDADSLNEKVLEVWSSDVHYIMFCHFSKFSVA